MMSRRLHRLVPTLVLLGALPGAVFAASAAEKSAQFEAVKSLIEREYRLPAKRQLEDFQKAGHPGAEWYLKVLSWFYADRFRVSSPDAAEKAALEKQAAALEKELEAAAKNGTLPAELRSLVSGSGQILRLVTDLLRNMDPDRPEPILKAKAFSTEQQAAMNLTVKALAEAMNQAWAEGAKKVKDNEKNDQDALGGDQKDPKIAKLLEQAVDLRLEAVRPVYLARKALREAAERGDQYGVDPAPAREALKAFVTKNFELLQEWDYNWGDYHAYLHAFIMDVSGDAPRFKVKKAVLDDVEADLMKTPAMDLAKEFAGSPNDVLDDIRTLQARSWAGILTWYRDLGRELDPRMYQRGVEKWAEFKDTTKGPHFRLDHRNSDRAMEVARVYIAAARLLAAKGDKAGAMAALTAVAGTKTNPLAGNAQEWMARLGGGGSGGDAGAGADWGAQPVAEEPSAVLATANAYLRTSGTLSDPAQARGMLLTAAVALRNGVLGLSNAAYAETADEVAPELWVRYASTLSKLELRWHAALVAQEGLRWVKARQAELRDKNPWRTKEGWTASGKHIQNLARSAINLSSALLSRAKGAGVSALYDETVSLVNTVAPEEGGKSIDEMQIIIRIQDGDYDGAIELARAYQKKYPEGFYKGAGYINTARSAKFTKLADAGEIKRTGDEMLADAEAVAKKADGDLATAKDADQKRELQRAKREVQRLKAVILNKQGKSAEVLAMLDANYWQSPPADEDESVNMLRIMCNATRTYYQDRVKDEKGKRDPAVLIADWPKYAASYEIWRTQKARLTAQADAVDRMGGSLAVVFQSIPIQVRAMRELPGAPAELGQINDVANRAFADLIEPTIPDNTNKPDLALYVANVLWSLDEHPRAVRLYEIFLKSLAKDTDALALRDTPKDILDPLDATLGSRPEFKLKWAEVRDLLIDDPQLSAKILEQDLAPDQWGEKKRDFLKAVESIRALREEVKKARVALGANFEKIDTQLAKLDGTAAQLGREIAVVANLATAYREMGKKDKANELYGRLIAYDPTNPDYLAAAVELTLDELKAGKDVPAATVESTQVKAARVRDAAAQGSPTYWLAVTQVQELYAFRKDTQSIDKRLNFDAKNQSTPADDLQLLPRNPRDDKRIRRSRNAMVTDLCRRYLELFKIPGVTVKASFKIDAVEIDGKPTSVFVPVDGTTFTAHRRELDNGTVTWFLWETGKEPPPEPEAAPAPVQAPAPAPAQPDKAPAQNDKAPEKKP